LLALTGVFAFLQYQASNKVQDITQWELHTRMKEAEARIKEADAQSNEAKKDAAIAIDSAAHANERAAALEIVATNALARTVPRKLNIPAFRLALKGKQKANVEIVFSQGDDDSYAFAGDLRDGFLLSHWWAAAIINSSSDSTARDWIHLPNLDLSPTLAGGIILASNQNGLPAVKAIEDALKVGGIERKPEIREVDDLPNGIIRLFIIPKISQFR
jgi:hypothetical protein